jgi:hypothetical protein
MTALLCTLWASANNSELLPFLLPYAASFTAAALHK